MTLARVYQLLQAALQGALAGYVPQSGGQVVMGIGWPAEDALMEGGVHSGNVYISLFDRSPARNTTRWLPQISTMNITAAGVTAAVSAPQIAANGTATVTLGGTLLANDAVAVALRRGSTTAGASARAGGADTLDTFATALADAINADATLAAWVNASASGAVVTLQNLLNVFLGLGTGVGNLGTLGIEYHRFMRQGQVTVWAKRHDDRDAVGDLLIDAMAQIEAQPGFIEDTLSSSASYGEYLRVILSGDEWDDGEIQRSLYKRHIFVELEHPQVVQIDAWPVLATIPQITATVGYPAAQIEVA